MEIMAGVALLTGLVLVCVAWIRRDEKWASTVFWLGILLLLLPIGWEVVEGVRDYMDG